MTTEISAHPATSRTMQGGDMLQADEVVAMLRLHDLGWGAKRLSKEFGCARNTVRRYLREGGAAPFKKPVRRTAFDGLDDWLRERFFRHDGNADVIRQELAAEHGIRIGLRSVELRVRQWRRELKAQSERPFVLRLLRVIRCRSTLGTRRCGLAVNGFAFTCLSGR